MGGGGGQSYSKSDTITTNTDQRVAVDSGIGLSGANGNVVNVNSSDAVKAIAQMGTDAIRKTGEAVVQLHETGAVVNANAWDKTLQTSSKLVEKLIDNAAKSYGVAEKAMDRYQPTDNKAQDASLMNMAMLAAAGVAAAFLLSRSK